VKFSVCLLLILSNRIGQKLESGHKIQLIKTDIRVKIIEEEIIGPASPLYSIDQTRNIGILAVTGLKP